MLPDIRFRSISTLCHGALWRWASGRLFSIWRNAGGSFRKSMLHVEIFRWGVRNVAASTLGPNRFTRRKLGANRNTWGRRMSLLGLVRHGSRPLAIAAFKR